VIVWAGGIRPRPGRRQRVLRRGRRV